LHVTTEPDDRGGRRAHDDSGSHYFDDAPAVPSDPVTIDVNLPDAAFVLETDRGVFSRGRLDAGTTLLLRSDPPLATSGDLLDLGCGTGAIALTMARRAPDATVWAVDVNERARALTHRNAARNGVDNIRVAAPDEVPDTVRFGTIWSNPPVRIGKAALHQLLVHWLGRLDDGGATSSATIPTATIVVQKHLGADSLQRWLAEQGHHVERVASRSGFRLLRIDRRSRGDGPGGH